MMSDEEDDLELLRMAALQSLNKPKPGARQHNAPLMQLQSATMNTVKSHGSFSLLNKHRGGMYKSASIRGHPRNGHFNGRMGRNTNLISIPISTPHTVELDASEKVEPKLALPQDRYCKPLLAPEEVKKDSSKFSRYDNDSDDSDSDDGSMPDEGESKLLRSSSLEALVQELEFEISGKPAIAKKPKIKRPKETTPVTDDAPAEEPCTTDDAIDLFDDKLDDKIDDVPEVVEVKVPKKEPDPPKERPPLLPSPPMVVDIKPREPRMRKGLSHVISSRPLKRPLLPRPSTFNGRSSTMDFAQRITVPDRPVAYALTLPPKLIYMPAARVPPPQQPPPMLQYTPASSYGNIDVPYIAPTSYPLKPLYSQPPPPPPPRALSPLCLSTEALTRSTIAMAPLSPRSAAFVLQNREIIEKRKRSPRHSYTPSPPRRLRSLSPRRYRSPTPPPRRTARSPPPPLLPPPLPARRRTPERSPKRDLRERVAVKRSDTRKRASPEPASKPETRTQNDAKTTTTTTATAPAPAPASSNDSDVILEARKRKFEHNNSVHKEGVIRLRPKAETPPTATPPAKDEPSPERTQTPDALLVDAPAPEDEVFDADIIETKIDDIFSDEESDEENEGRFKVAASSAKKTATVMPFSMSKPPREVKEKPLEDNGRARDWRDRDRRDRRDRVERVREWNGRSRLSPLERGERRSRSKEHRPDKPVERKDREDGRADRKDNRDDRKEHRDAKRDERKDVKKDDRREAPKKEREPKEHVGEEEKEKRPSIKDRLTLKKDGGGSKVLPVVESMTPSPTRRSVEPKSSNNSSKRSTKRPAASDDEKEEEIRQKDDDRVRVKHARKSDEAAGGRKGRTKERPIAAARKVAISQPDTDAEKDVILTVIDDDEDDDGDDDQRDAVKKTEGGDLRAQLSRKRAERQSHQKATVSAEDVQSRLLHNALGAVFQKTKKSKRGESKAEAAAASAAKADKVPVRQRLGVTKDVDAPQQRSSRKKRRKRGNDKV